MKTSRQSQQDMKFRKQLSNWQSVIGTPHWSYKSPTFDEIKIHEQQGHKLQAQAFQTYTKRSRKLLKKSGGKVIQFIKMLIKSQKQQGCH